MTLPILLQMNEGPSLLLADLPGLTVPGLTVFLRDMDSDRRDKSETRLL